MVQTTVLCPSLQLFFAKVLRSATEEEVKELFCHYGRVVEVNLFRAFQVRWLQLLHCAHDKSIKRLLLRLSLPAFPGAQDKLILCLACLLCSWICNRIILLTIMLL